MTLLGWGKSETTARLTFLSLSPHTTPFRKGERMPTCLLHVHFLLDVFFSGVLQGERQKLSIFSAISGNGESVDSCGYLTGSLWVTSVSVLTNVIFDTCCVWRPSSEVEFTWNPVGSPWYARTTRSLGRPKIFRELFDFKHFIFKASADSEIYLNEICHLVSMEEHFGNSPTWKSDEWFFFSINKSSY